MSIWAEVMGKTWNCSFLPKADADCLAVGACKKGLATRNASRSAVPTAISGGRGGRCQLLLGAVVGYSFLIMVFKCLPTWHFLHFGLQFCSLWAIILSPFFYFFWAFSRTNDFLKIVLPCRRELDFHHPGISKIIQKANTKRFSL